MGNLRSFLLADFIRRALLYHGIDVLHVKNITDVGHMRDERRDSGGDRLMLAAEVEGKTTQQIADFYEAAFHADEAAVNILPAHRFPRATEHIPQMLALAERLVDGGFAYATPEGTVYFDVSAFPGYGRLSGNTLDELHEGHRVEVEPDKDDPADFALWKHAEEGRLLKWPTAALGRRLPRLAPGMLGNVPRVPGRPVRDPHGRHRQRVPAPRGRDRAEHRRNGSATRCPLGPWRAPPDARPEDGQVRRQLPTRHRARR